MNAITHMGELLPGSLPKLGSEPRDMALACCRDMQLCFGPLSVPALPQELMRFSASEVLDIIGRHDRDQRIEEQERVDLGNALRWRLQRTAVLHENTARLRAALWAQVALREAITLDPEEQDLEPRQFLPMLQEFCVFEWRLWHGVRESALNRSGVSGAAWSLWLAEGSAPDALPERNAIANLHAWLWQREATYPHRQPTQELLHV